MRVRFLAGFNWSPPELPRGRFSIAFKGGMELTVRRCCGEAAIAAGCAVALPAPRRGSRQ